jgi:hypothetical protein
VADSPIQWKIVKNACKEYASKCSNRMQNQNSVRTLTSKMLHFVRRSKRSGKTVGDFQNDSVFVLQFYKNELKKQRLIDFNGFRIPASGFQIQENSQIYLDWWISR